MSLRETSIARLDGTPATFGEIVGDRTALVVNVASKCGLTPQYTALEALHERYAERGFTVVGVPCNQFGEQEPGGPEEIAQFCSATYGVTFPMTEKVDVNGDTRHPLFDTLTEAPNEKGRVGDVEWNFEKWLVAPDGRVLARFRPGVEPGDERVVAAVEARLG